jgi:hypothetical protein
MSSSLSTVMAIVFCMYVQIFVSLSDNKMQWLVFNLRVCCFSSVKEKTLILANLDLDAVWCIC